MKIREATAADAPAIRAIVTETLAEFGLRIESDGIDMDLDEVPTSYQSRGGAFRVLVADDDATIVGCGGIYPIEPGTVELRKMYFRPEVRGKGWGRSLLEDLMNTAKNGGYTRMVLETASNLKSAIALYERSGFSEVKGPHHSGRCDRSFGRDLQ